MLTAISLTDNRLTKWELHVLRTIALRLSGGLSVPSQTYLTKATLAAINLSGEVFSREQVEELVEHLEQKNS